MKHQTNLPIYCWALPVFLTLMENLAATTSADENEDGSAFKMDVVAFRQKLEQHISDNSAAVVTNNLDSEVAPAVSSSDAIKAIIFDRQSGEQLPTSSASKFSQLFEGVDVHFLAFVGLVGAWAITSAVLIVLLIYYASGRSRKLKTVKKASIGGGTAAEAERTYLHDYLA